jgi:hypothetical protein
MLIAIAVLFVLYLTGPQRERQIDKKTMSRVKVVPRARAPQKTTISADHVNQKNSDCPHRFGYLSARGEKNVPEECVGCARMIKCLLPDE